MNTVMKAINNMYKKTPTLEQTELSKLESLLTQVGCNAASVLLKADEISMAEFLDTCIRNGITFELHENRLKGKGSSEKETSYKKKDWEDASEKSCVEAGECGERITFENWGYLAPKVGDQVYVRVAGDIDFASRSTYTITQLYGGETNHQKECFLSLDDWWYNYSNKVEHELYLIRTPEGSLHDK